MGFATTVFPLLWVGFSMPVDSVNFTLVTVSTSDIGRYGFYVTNPQYHVLIGMLKEVSPLVFTNFTHISLRSQNSSFTGKSLTKETEYCNGAEYIMQTLAPFYYENPQQFTGNLNDQFTLLTNDDRDCTEVGLQLANFASATSTFLGLYSYSMQFSNNVRYPTTLSLFATPDEYFAYTLGYLARNCSWTEINVIHKQNDDNFFMAKQRANFFEYLRHHDLKVDFIVVGYSGNGSSMFDDYVWKRVTRKRVSLILLQPNLMRQFMIEAHGRNLTNGDYVFATYNIQGIPSSDNIFWKQDDDTDKVALLAFRALLVVQDGDEWDGAENLSQSVRNEIQRRYNWTMAAKDLATADAIRVYEWLEVFAQMFLRLQPKLSDLTVEEFVREAANRTYRLPSRRIYLNDVNAMIVPIPILRLSPSGTFETILTFSVSNKNIQSSHTRLDWFGDEGIPGDLPVCGLHGEKCLSQNSLEEITILLAVFCTLSLACFFSVLSSVRLKTRRRHQLQFFLAPQDFSFYVS